MDGDLFHDRVESSSAPGETVQQRSTASTDDGFGDERGAETEDASDDDEIDEDGDVEYTLKDRQDVSLILVRLARLSLTSWLE